MAYLMRKKIEINKHFIHKSGCAVYPSTNPADSPFDTFTCKICGEKFILQMYGYMQRDEESFDEKAGHVLLEHVNKCHAEVADEEIVPGKGRLIGYFRDPSVEAVRKRLNIQQGSICPGCGCTIYGHEIQSLTEQFITEQICRCWQQGHFDILIYEEV